MIKDQQIKGDSFFHKTLDAGEAAQERDSWAPPWEEGRAQGAASACGPGHSHTIVFFPEHYIQQSHLLVQTKQQEGYWGEEILAKSTGHFYGGSRVKDKLSQAWLQCVGAWVNMCGTEQAVVEGSLVGW